MSSEDTRATGLFCLFISLFFPLTQTRHYTSTQQECKCLQPKGTIPSGSWQLDRTLPDSISKCQLIKLPSVWILHWKPKQIKSGFIGLYETAYFYFHSLIYSVLHEVTQRVLMLLNNFHMWNEITIVQFLTPKTSSKADHLSISIWLSMDWFFFLWQLKRVLKLFWKSFYIIRFKPFSIQVQ